MNKRSAVIFVASLLALAAIASGIVCYLTPKYSSLTLYGENIFALNSSAQKAEIKSGSRSQYMYFKFTNNQQVRLLNLSKTDEGASVKITLKPLEPKKVMIGQASFNFGFLYREDFSGQYSLKKTISNRATVAGEYSIVQQKEFAVSKCIDRIEQIPAGFFVYCSSDIALTALEFEKACIGFDRSREIPLYAYPSEGGKVDYSFGSVDFTSAKKMFASSNSLTEVMPVIELELSKTENIGDYKHQKSLTVISGKEEIKVRRSPEQTKITLQAAALKTPYSKMIFSDEGVSVKSCLMSANRRTLLPVSHTAIAIEGGESVAKKSTYSAVTPLDENDAVTIAPITTDIGMVFDWPKKNWRCSKYELYSWEMFPSVLLFDFADYRTQNLFLTRLAYFVEKAGYKGTFISDEDVRTKHGYNAHDYKSDDLAAFFTQAELQKFHLNEEEKLLCEILIANRIILKNKDGTYTAGNGAIISISKESPEYLRWKLSAHESWHGIYFTDEDFRNKVLSMYSSFDRTTMEFLQTYWATQETLSYDITDDYLMKNEFMAYLLQQNLASTKDYFLQIAGWASVNKNEPELARYVRRTEAQPFVDATAELNDYVFNRWGLAAGRVNLLSR